MFGASLICREFKSWSARPWLLFALLQEELCEEATERGKLNISVIKMMLSFSHHQIHTHLLMSQ